MNITRDEVIERFCTIARVVGEAFDWEHPADCFCCKRSISEFEFSPVILRFIEFAVRTAIEEKLSAPREVSAPLLARAELATKE